MGKENKQSFQENVSTICEAAMHGFKGGVQSFSLTVKYSNDWKGKKKSLSFNSGQN